MLTKQEILLGKGAWVESRREGNPGELLCPVARSLGFYGDGISFQVVFSQSLFFFFHLFLLVGGKLQYCSGYNIVVIH